MKTEIAKLSILRGFIEPLPSAFDSSVGELKWTPSIEVDSSALNAASPTTEYSSQEGNE